MNANLKVLTGRQAGNIRSTSSQKIWISENESKVLEIGKRNPGKVPKSALLTKVENGWILEPQTGNDWFIDGKKVALRDKAKIKPGSAIRLSWMGPDINFSLGKPVKEVWGVPVPQEKSSKATGKPVVPNSGAASKNTAANGNARSNEPQPIVVQSGSRGFGLIAAVLIAASILGLAFVISRVDLKGDTEPELRALAENQKELEKKTDKLEVKTDKLATKTGDLETKTDELETKTDEIEIKFEELKKAMAPIKQKRAARREELFALVMNKRDQDKARADKDVERLAVDRAQIKEDLAEQIQILEARKRELELRKESRVDIVTALDQKEYVKGEFDYSAVSNRVARLERRRTQRMEELTKASVQANLGAINSGSALNLMLDRLGPIASEYVHSVKHLKSEIENLERLVRTRSQQAIPGEGLSADEQQLIRMQSALKILESIQFGELPKICYPGAVKTGPFNTSARYNAKHGPLHVNWRKFEFLKGFDHELERSRIDKCLEDAIENLKRGDYVDVETIDELYDANEDLRIGLEGFGRKSITHLPMHHPQFTAYIKAKDEHKKMSRDFEHLLDIDAIEYIAPATEFTGSSIADLLAYMNDNGLKFEKESSRGTQRKNFLTFKQILGFQSAIVAAQMAVETEEVDTSGLDDKMAQLKIEAESEIARNDAMTDQAMDVRYESYFDDLHKIAKETSFFEPDVTKITINDNRDYSTSNSTTNSYPNVASVPQSSRPSSGRPTWNRPSSQPSGGGRSRWDIFLDGAASGAGSKAGEWAADGVRAGWKKLKEKFL